MGKGEELRWWCVCWRTAAVLTTVGSTDRDSQSLGLCASVYPISTHTARRCRYALFEPVTTVIKQQTITITAPKNGFLIRVRSL